MHLLSSLIFAVSTSADNLAAGFSFGLKRKKIGWGTAVFICLIIFLGTFLAMAVGQSVLLLIPDGLGGPIGGAGMLFMGFIGVLKGILPHRKKQEEKETVDDLSLQDAATIGLALTFNNAILGIGAGLTGMNIWLTSLGSFGCGLLFLYFGSKLARMCLPASMERYTELAGNLLMMGLGLFEIFI